MHILRLQLAAFRFKSKNHPDSTMKLCISSCWIGMIIFCEISQEFCPALTRWLTPTTFLQHMAMSRENCISVFAVFCCVSVPERSGSFTNTYQTTSGLLKHTKTIDRTRCRHHRPELHTSLFPHSLSLHHCRLVHDSSIPWCLHPRGDVQSKSSSHGGSKVLGCCDPTRVGDPWCLKGLRATNPLHYRQFRCHLCGAGGLEDSTGSSDQAGVCMWPGVSCEVCTPNRQS